ncbi:MAG: hypothetical protein KDC27_12945 [Acidobacteria bacterium]|nr:hypothetical protein [Acidobacteriota bacterium]
MSIPRFTAEAALEARRQNFQEAGRAEAGPAVVEPQARACILLPDGGQWCCVHIPLLQQPVCWRVPPKPPPIIWV